MSEPRHVIDLIVVYDHPSDYPDEYVARMHRVFSDGDAIVTEALAISADLDTVRAAIPPGFYCIGRAREDDPVILEVWI